MIFSIIVFCLGVFLMIKEALLYDRTLEMVREKLKSNELYQQYNDLDQCSVTYAEVIATLFQPLDYDIRIDNILYRRNYDYSYEIDENSIPKKNYYKSYQYDSEGNINMILYSCEG